MKRVRFIVDGNTLRGTFFYPQNVDEKNPSVFFIQGWTGDMRRSYGYARALSELGYVCFLFDVRGHGQSGGDIKKGTIRDFLNDVTSAYDYFAGSKGVDPNNINVIGSSFGGYMGSILTSKRNVKNIALRVPADYDDGDFDKSKWETSGVTTPEVWAFRKRIKKPSESMALAALHKFGGKVLIIESEKDDVVPHETILNYMNAVSDKTNLTHVVVKGAPHSTKRGPFREKVEKIYVEWFKKLAK
ncbi:alpha/beta fold hydrolase [Patescibacteria group bacterium]|nr:alpha/beta fold hydrolase [Patescibacteria group bacterium]